MPVKVLYLPGFSHRLSGSRAKSAANALGGSAEHLGGLAALCERFIPAGLLSGESGTRSRCFPLPVVFWAFLSQVLTRNSSCREAVRRVQAWCAACGRTVPDSGTAGYCMAWARLPLGRLVGVFEKLGEWFAARASRDHLWCGRTVQVIDGTGVSMPDTAENRKRWSYAPNQKTGCGFPSAHLVGLFCLGTGRLVRFALDSFKRHELPMARTMIGWIESGTVILADRGFCGWGFLALLQRKGVDVVVRVDGMRKLDRRASLTQWLKPARLESWNKSLWNELPDLLNIRLIRFRVVVPGFRTETIVLATTLLDSAIYSDHALAELYLRRWRVELFMREIKVTMGLDVLRGQSPAVVGREIWMQAIGYNLVRALMFEVSLRRGLALDRISFKGTVDTLRHWAPLFLAVSARKQKSHRAALLELLADDRLPLRPNRFEPRVRKRRPKQYPLLTRSRRRLRRQIAPGGTASFNDVPAYLSAILPHMRRRVGAGARIRFGVVNEVLELGGNVACLLNLNWWSSGHLVSETLCVPATVWAAAIGEACVWGRLMGPPYLAVAIAEPDGFVRQLRLYACYGDGRYLVPAESEYERAFSAFLVSRDVAFLKPVLRTDLDKVLPPLGVRLPEPLGFRPDFGVCKRLPNGAIRVYVTELRGFPSGKFAAYDESLNEKARKVRGWGEPFVYKEPSGAVYQFTQTTDPVFEDLAVGWKGPSPSADWWLRHSAGEGSAHEFRSAE